MKLLRSTALLLLFNLSLANGVSLEVVGERRKNIGLDIYNRALKPEEEKIQKVFNKEEKNFISYSAEFANSGSDFNPFQLWFDFSRETVFRGYPLYFGIQGRRDKIESGWENNSATHDMIRAFLYDKNLRFDLSYKEKVKELLRLDTRKESTFKASTVGSIRDPLDLNFNFDMEKRGVTANEQERKFDLFALELGLQYEQNNLKFYDLLTSDLSFKLAYLGEYLAVEDAALGRYDSVYRADLGLKLFASLYPNMRFEANLIGEYANGPGYGVSLKLSMDVNKNFKFDASAGIEKTRKQLMKLLDSTADFDAIAPLGLAKESGYYGKANFCFQQDEVRADLNVNLGYFFDKIAAEVNDEVEGNPVRFVNLTRPSLLMDATLKGACDLQKFEISALYKFCYNDGLAFLPMSKVEGRVRFNHKSFFVGTWIDYRSSFYTRHLDSNSSVAGYYTLNSDTGFHLKENFKITISFLNMTDVRAEYKQGFNIDKRKIKLDLQFNF